jgi:hypothetical protein
MVKDGRHLCKEPLMWTISQEKDILLFCAAEITPSSRNNGSDTRPMHSLDENFGHTLRIINDNTAEADVDGTRALSQEVCEVGRRCIVGRFSEKEAANI